MQKETSKREAKMLTERIDISEGDYAVHNSKTKVKGRHHPEDNLETNYSTFSSRNERREKTTGEPKAPVKASERGEVRKGLKGKETTQVEGYQNSDFSILGVHQEDMDQAKTRIKQRMSEVFEANKEETWEDVDKVQMDASKMDTDMILIGEDDKGVYTSVSGLSQKEETWEQAADRKVREDNSFGGGLQEIPEDVEILVASVTAEKKEGSFSVETVKTLSQSKTKQANDAQLQTTNPKQIIKKEKRWKRMARQQHMTVENEKTLTNGPKRTLNEANKDELVGLKKVEGSENANMDTDRILTSLKDSTACREQ